MWAPGLGMPTVWKPAMWSGPSSAVPDFPKSPKGTVRVWGEEKMSGDTVLSGKGSLDSITGTGGKSETEGG